MLCSTIPKSNIRPDIDNLIVKISGYDINDLVVNWYSNVLMELKIIVRYINKKGYLYIIVFHNVEKKLCRKRILRYNIFRWDTNDKRSTSEITRIHK